MVDPNDQPENPDVREGDLMGVIADLPNEDFLAVLDRVLLELEKRLYRYARVGAEVHQMADEGLVLAARSAARLGQAQSAAGHAQGHLQLVGVGDWKPTGTRPAWNQDPRVTGEGSEP
jgi:hypothetical protein